MMYRSVWILLSIFMLLFSSGNALAKERITNFDVTIMVNSGSIDVVEKITVQVEHQDIRLGIIRNLIDSYSLGGKTIGTELAVKSVKRDGQNENFWLEHSGGMTAIYTGARSDSRGLLRRGLHTYEIAWSAKNHIKSFDSYDELYFNATGNDWAFAIDNAKVTVVLPKGVKILQYAGYAGKAGSSEQVESTLDNARNSVTFTAQRLNKREGVTVAIGFEKGFAINPVEIDGFYGVMNSIISISPSILSVQTVVVLFIFIITLIFYIIVWYFKGRDDIGVVTPLFELPKSISPAIAETIWSRGRVSLSSRKSFAATIVNLARQGFLIFHNNNLDNALQRTDLDGKPMYKEEKDVLDIAFPNVGDIEVLNRGNKSIYKAYKNYSHYTKRLLGDFVIRNIHFIVIALALDALVALAISPRLALILGKTALLFGVYVPFYVSTFRIAQEDKLAALKTGIYIFAYSMTFLFITFPKLTGFIPSSPAYFTYLISFICLIVLHMTFLKWMDRVTDDGCDIMTQLKGLYMFMKTVDKDRYRLITPEIFEKNLPFAIIFGLEKKWLKMFNEVYPTYIAEHYQGDLHNITDFSAFSRGILRAAHNPVSTGGLFGGFGSGSGGGGSVGGFGSSGGGGGGGR